MQKIPFVDIRQNGPKQLVQDYPERTKALIHASRNTFGFLSDMISSAVLPSGDRISLEWLQRTKNPYLDEIRDFAQMLNVTGIYALNICFEWGCTSAVYTKSSKPTLTRVLDWTFPKLGENIIIAHQKGIAGDFYNVTWPGMSGMFQGMAPERFAASLNQAPMQRHHLTYIGDWIKNRQQVFKTNALPPEHLLRMAFENARNFDEAKDMLCKTSVALPVIYTLSGIHDGEGCVIERIENDFAVRLIEIDRVCVSNQFDTKLNALGYGWRARPINSAGRVEQARTLPLTTVDEEFSWLKPPIANSHTRLAMTACAAKGEMSVVGMNGNEMVTEIYRLKLSRDVENAFKPS